MIYKKCLLGGTDSEFRWTHVKFSRHHIADLKHNLDLSMWAAIPAMAAGEAGPKFPICVGVLEGVVIQEGEEKDSH